VSSVFVVGGGVGEEEPPPPHAAIKITSRMPAIVSTTTLLTFSFDFIWKKNSGIMQANARSAPFLRSSAITVDEVFTVTVMF
jgi:hypothetical protein